MARCFSLLVAQLWFSAIVTIAGKAEDDKVTGLLQGNSGLEPGRGDRHCLT
jgi:hypothetical protein